LLEQADKETKAIAARVLVRYLPEGPVGSEEAKDWQGWMKENRPWLFFSDPGGFRWYLDRFAKRKGVPSKEFRGEARASRTWPPKRGR